MSKCPNTFVYHLKLRFPKKIVLPVLFHPLATLLLEEGLLPAQRKRILMKTSSILALLGAATIFPLEASTVVIDDFEAGSFNSDWDSTTGATITTGTGAEGSANFASIAAGSGPLGATFDGGTSIFSIDFYVNVQATANRQFNLQVSSISVAPNTNSATVNLRYQGGWAAFNGAAWAPIAGLGGLTDGEWHRVNVSGNDWGLPTASFDIQVSDAGGSAFTSSASGITAFQSGDPTTDPALSFNFNSAFGSNPGFSVDNVTVSTIPEPSTGILALLALTFGVSRRRR